jgi:cation transport ATPase
MQVTCVKTISPGSKPRSTAFGSVAICWSTGTLRLRDEDLFGDRLSELCPTFLRRIFALREVKFVEIDRERHTAEIGLDTDRKGLAQHLQRLARAIRGETPEQFPPIAERPVLEDLVRSGGRVKIRRLDSVLTTWDVVDHHPGRIRLRHESIRLDPALAARVHDIVTDTFGVMGCAVQLLTGSVLIRFDPAVVTASRLLQILERERRRPALPDLETSIPVAPGYGLSNTSLVLATAGEFAAPALLPVCAILLVGSNLSTFRAAGRQLLQGHIGLAALYASIVAATLASGQFIASAVMSWMFVFWHRRYYDQLKKARRRLLGELIGQTNYVRLAGLETTGSTMEIPIDDLSPGDVILISAGEQIPVDGRVFNGQGLVDERLIRGVHGLNRKGLDDTVLAGSTLWFGRLQVKVGQQSSPTRATALAKVIRAVTTPAPSSRAVSLRGEQSAERAIMPTMAIAGLGLLVGDVNTAGAILRPDYATGPGLAFPLETLQAVTLCLRHGIVISNPESLERIATSDLLIIDHSPALEQTQLEISTIEAFPGIAEDELLRFANAAFRHLDDERAVVLRGICRERELKTMDVHLAEFSNDVTLIHGKDCIKVGDLGTRPSRGVKASSSENSEFEKQKSANSLMVGINGRVAGLIHFRRSGRLEAALALKRLRSKRSIQVGMISSQPDQAFAPLAASLGVDFHIGNLTLHDRIHLLKSCRERGFKVAYVGDCCHDPHIAAEVQIAISLIHDGNDSLHIDSATIQLLQPQLLKLAELWDIAHIHERRLKMAYNYTLIPNLLCVAGALMWGFSSLAAVAMTNLGTYGLYLRTETSIRGLEDQIFRSLAMYSGFTRESLRSGMLPRSRRRAL